MESYLFLANSSQDLRDFIGVTVLLVAIVLAISRSKNSRGIKKPSAKSKRLSREMEALAAGGEDDLPPLVNALSDPQAEVRRCAVNATRSLTSGVDRLIPALIERLKDEDEGVVSAAIQTLISLKAQPDIVMPALLNVLKDPRPAVRRWVLNSWPKVSTSTWRLTPSIFLPASN